MQAAMVKVVHWLIVAASAAAPFSDDIHLVAADAVWLAGVMVHWLCNDNTCALTILEKSILGVDDQHSFFHAVTSSLFTPKFADATTGWLVWFVTLSLFGLCVCKCWPRLPHLRHQVPIKK